MLQSAAYVAVTSFRNRIVEVIVRNTPRVHTRRRVIRGSLNRNIMEKFIINPVLILLHGKNDFIEVFKNLAGYRK